MTFNKKTYNKYWRQSNRARENASARKRFVLSSSSQKLYRYARIRATRDNLIFALTVSDIIVPLFCPYLGIPLGANGGLQRDNTPSLDRIDNTKGYIRGNIEVISLKANRMKQDASKEELRTFAQEILRRSYD